MDDDFKTFLAYHMIDVVLIIVVVVKLISGGLENLGSKLLRLFFFSCALYLFQVMSAKWLGPDTSVFWTLGAIIVSRLIAVKLAFTIIDSYY